MAQMQSSPMLTEMMLFANFAAAEQRFIRRSLDVGLNRCDSIACWARNPAEIEEIAAQARRYRALDLVRAWTRDDEDAPELFLASLISLTTADLAEGKIGSFDAYAFLYERLVGPEVRPWLVSAFCAAASLPGLHPDHRKSLMQTVPLASVAAAGWSIRVPLFYPEWVEKVPEVVS